MEISRLVLGVLVAIALPGSISALRDRLPLAALVSLFLSLYAVVPVLNGWEAFAVTFSAVIAAICTLLLRNHLTKDAESGKNEPATAPFPFRTSGLAALLILVSAFPIGLTLVAYYGNDAMAHLMESTGGNATAIVLFGLLAAVFIGNDVAYLSVLPLIRKLRTEKDGGAALVPQGQHVGWIERSVIFSFVAGGQADAAALAVAAKALIRLPQVQDEKEGSAVGEYIIVGTLASVVASIAAAVIVRLALGLPAL
ncbi:MAG TPA: hypothetical protein VN408_42710 [Actinoplanes sp.]|nr:hypothetical protein [Actinoplanes sp.]